MKLRLGLLCTSLFACATNKAPPPQLLKPQAPLPPSSIAALLEKRADLDLSDEQVAQLSEIDRKREDADRAVEVDLHDQVGDSQNLRLRKGNPQMKAMQTRAGRAARESAPKTDPPVENDYFDVAQQRLAENDTRAYADAEKLLTDAQRPLAKVIVDKYREDVAKQFQSRTR